jgi:hypothetical protein
LSFIFCFVGAICILARLIKATADTSIVYLFHSWCAVIVDLSCSVFHCDCIMPIMKEQMRWRILIRSVFYHVIKEANQETFWHSEDRAATYTWPGARRSGQPSVRNHNIQSFYM